MEFLAILSSVPFESKLILSELKNIRRLKIAGKTVYEGRISKIKILLINTGIGVVNAAHSATGVSELFPIRFIINSGIGGAYPGSGLGIGDIAVASRETYGDTGAITSKTQRGIKEMGIPLVQRGKKKYFSEFPLDKKFLKKAVKTFNKLVTLHALRITKIKSGNFVTVSTTGTHKRAKELEKRFNAICENMEGAAIAQVCTIYKIPLLEIRGVSNIAGVHDKRKWDLKLASENCQKVVLEIINSPEDYTL